MQQQQQSGESPHSNNSIVNICEACSSVSQSQRPDDTDSFTPRVRSDKKSIILLLGKAYIFEEDLINFSMRILEGVQPFFYLLNIEKKSFLLPTKGQTISE